MKNKKYIDCPHCNGLAMEQNSDSLCGFCHGDLTVLAGHRVETETEKGLCDTCGISELIEIEYNVYTNHEEKESWEYSRSLCQTCASH